MNSASQNFPHHLGGLRERMLHPTDYEKAVHYFLGARATQRLSVIRPWIPCRTSSSAGARVTSKAIGRQVELAGALVSHLRAHRFLHGNAQVDGRVVLFFYFLEGDTGMMMLIPGVRGEGDVARFHLSGGLADPRKN